MSKGTDRLLKNVKQFADVQYKLFTRRYGQQVIDILEFPIKLVLSPFTLAYDIAGSAPRGFGVPEFISKLSFTAIFAVAYLGTYDIALELGKKVLCQRNCRTCNGWQALRCTMCKGSGKVHYQVKNYSLKSGEKATAECVADAIADNRAELVHLPSTMDLHLPLPSKDCPTCDGSGVMGCPECKDKLQVRISADDIMEPPWIAYNILRKMDYPYEDYCLWGDFGCKKPAKDIFALLNAHKANTCFSISKIATVFSLFQNPGNIKLFLGQTGSESWLK